MKRFTFLIVAFTTLVTSSQVFGQTDGENNGNVQLPAVQQARDAFFASLNAYQLAQDEAAYWQLSQGRRQHPNAATAATYFQISASYQFQSLARLYAVWMSLEQHGILLPAIGQLLGEAETYSLYAGWYAMAGASTIGSQPIQGHPVVEAAAVAYEEIELLIPIVVDPDYNLQMLTINVGVLLSTPFS